MKKQAYKCSIALFVILFAIAASSYGQSPNLLPAGKYLLKMKATQVHLLAATDQPEHSILVSVARSGNDVAISTDKSTANITGQFRSLTDGSAFVVFAFSVKGASNWITLKGTVSRSASVIDGNFVFVPTPNGPPAGVPESQHSGTVGTFTFVPYNEKLQPVADPGKTKEVYNSTEEWWTGFKKWMAGESF